MTNLFNINYADRLLEDMLLFKTFCQQVNMLDIKYLNKTFTCERFYKTVLNRFIFICNAQFYVLVASLRQGYFEENGYNNLVSAELKALD